jgi:hypothetical protein
MAKRFQPVKVWHFTLRATVPMNEFWNQDPKQVAAFVLECLD